MLITKDISGTVEQEMTDCDLCGSENYFLWSRSRSNELTKCEKCGLVWTNPRIKKYEEKDKRLYNKDYFLQKNRFTKKQVAARNNVYKKEISKLERQIDTGEILDVGCGTGIFLSNFSEKWKKYGCDISSWGLKEAGQKGIKVYHGEFDKIDFENKKFDVIYFRASLHHTYSPQRSLERADELLKDKGILAICMSNNCSGLMGRLFRGHIRSYEQAHNYLFSRKTLLQYLKANNFEPMEYYYPYWGTGYESIFDIPVALLKYLIYIIALMLKKENGKLFRNFASPAFYGNNVNVYAKKR
jgi:ubiquinone/menaquinone biosynthesis C-methylase UbiE